VIGNDIIDIAYTRQHSDWTRKGFLNKVFTKDEQSYITKSNDPFGAVWRLWSMKESVYKLHLRSTQVRSFYPSKIICHVLDDKIGIVLLDGSEYDTTTSSFNDYIFSFAMDTDSTDVYHDIIKYDNQLHENYFATIKNKLAINLDCKSVEIDIIKNSFGIPQIYCKDKKQDVFISITHHGNFLAWSLVSTKKEPF